MAVSQIEALTASMSQIEKNLELVMNRPASKGGIQPASMFGSNTPNGFVGKDWRSDDWPDDKIRAMEAYGTPAAYEMYGGRRGKTLTGIGPALVKLAAMRDKDARSLAIAKGWMPHNYGDEQFDKEYGFCTVGHAAEQGVRKYDRVSKRLTNERRKVALAENAGQTGGYIVPPQFMNELLTIAAEDGFIEQRAKVLPMTTRTADWPMLDITTVQAAGTSPYFGGILATWQPEAATINETEPQFKQSTWTAWDLMMFAVSSNQLLADNGIGLDAMLTQLFAAAMIWYKEYAYLQGKGAGSTMPLGVLNAPATLLQTRSVAGRFTYADACAMLSHLQVRSWDDACWVMHQSVLPQLCQMVDNATSNRLVWVGPMGNSPANHGPAALKLPTAFLNGLPIYFTEKLPALGNLGDVLLVDWSKYVIGTRLDVQIDISPHYRFQNNQLCWRVVCRGDGKPWMNSFITDSSGWQLSPFVALR